MQSCRNVLILEERGLVSHALVELLGAAPGLKVVGVASNIRMARGLLKETPPDLMVSDLLFDDGSAIELLRQFRRERLSTRVVIFTDLKDPFAVREAVSAGARGYVLKRQPVAELLEAIAKVSTGGRYLSPDIDLEHADGPSDGSERSGLQKLSAREREILRLIAAGLTGAEISRRLSISTKTIDTHRSNMYRKLALRNTVDLMRFATAHGIGIAPGSGSHSRQDP